jgi:hypothetical protein
MNLEIELLRYIDERMAAEGKTRSALARYMGKAPSTITKLFAKIDPHRSAVGDEGREQRNLKIEDLEQMLRFLGIEFSHDVLVASRKVYVTFAPLRGTVAHGIWREREMLSKQGEDTRIQIPSLPISEFAHLDQYALQVADTHAEKYVSQNGYILCVDFLLARTSPKHEDIVVIERQVKVPAATRNVCLIERAIRQVVIEGSDVLLKPLTDSPNVDEIRYAADDQQVRITELVVGSFLLSPNMKL